MILSNSARKAQISKNWPKKPGRSIPNEREYWVYEDQKEYDPALDALEDILKQIYATVKPFLEHDFEPGEHEADVLVLDGLHLARRVLVRLAIQYDTKWSEYQLENKTWGNKSTPLNEGIYGRWWDLAVYIIVSPFSAWSGQTSRWLFHALQTSISIYHLSNLFVLSESSKSYSSPIDRMDIMNVGRIAIMSRSGN